MNSDTRDIKMSKNTVSLNLDVKLDDLAYLISSAFSVISYWAAIEDYVYPPEEPNMKEYFEDSCWLDGKGHVYTEQLPLLPGASLLLRDKEEDEVYTFDIEAVKRGLALMQKNSPRHFGDFLAENADADTGDVFVQYCLFGEVKYG